LSAKGVESVKSRVINLKELNPELTIRDVKLAIGEAFEAEYGKAENVYTISEENAPEQALERYHHYASWDWLFGKTPDFDVTFEEKFTWGELVLSFKLKGAVIEDSGIYSDAMSTDLVDVLKTLFNGKKMERAELINALSQANLPLEMKAQFDEIAEWVGTLPI
jgi:lipoate-protein ligase A